MKFKTLALMLLCLTASGGVAAVAATPHSADVTSTARIDGMTVDVFGDSITSGSGETPWVQQWAGATGWAVRNWAKGGATLVDYGNPGYRVMDQVNQATASGTLGDTAIIAAGTNDMGRWTVDTMSDPGGPKYAAIGILRALQAAGVTKVVFTQILNRGLCEYRTNMTIPCAIGNGAVPTLNQRAAAYNTWLKAMWKTAVVNMGGWWNPNAYESSNGVHPNQAGAWLLAQQFDAQGGTTALTG